MLKKRLFMTELGLYFAKKSINKADVSRKTGIRPNRLGDLTLNKNSHLRVKELYLIALAIEIDPCELLQFVCKDEVLPN